MGLRSVKYFQLGLRTKLFFFEIKPRTKQTEASLKARPPIVLCGGAQPYRVSPGEAFLILSPAPTEEIFLYSFSIL
jgi:hypothetical protein